MQRVQRRCGRSARRRDTDGQPTFPEVWARIEPLIQGLPLVAHNRPFNQSCLKAVFAEYGMEYPDYEFYCTLVASRRCFDLPSHQLHLSAAACGYNMENHHHALADAEACAAMAFAESAICCEDASTREYCRERVHTLRGKLANMFSACDDAELNDVCESYTKEIDDTDKS